MLPNCVLVVEDEPSLRSVFRRAIEGAGFRVLSAATASEALAIWEEQAKEIPVILIDQNLHNTISGEEAVLRICADNPNTKIILMSGRQPNGEQLPEGWVFLAKPFSISELIRVIGEAFSRSRA